MTVLSLQPIGEKVGSADEAPAEAGFAHFLEHMLFKDAAAKETGRASTGQMARTIESLGGDINAYTSFDQTVYHVTCAAHHWERILDAFGTMAKPQKFLKSDFEREREVILEELRKNEDSPGRQLFQSLFSETFQKHPYGKPVIGYVKTLNAAKVQALEAFYRRNYISGKMGLVLVGPVDDQTGARKKGILKYLEKHFGSKVLPKREAAWPARKHEPELRSGPSLMVRPFDVKTPTISFSFRAPDLLNEDIPALDLMIGILGAGELSRLYQKMFVQTSLATDVSGGMYIPKDPGMLYFQAELDDVAKVEEAARQVFGELRKIRDEGPTAEELNRMIVSAESERLYATQTADGLAGRLGFLKFILGDLEYDQKYLEQLRAVDSAKIREVARKYLEPRRLNGVLLLPKDHAKYDLAPIEKIAREILAPSAKAAQKSTKTQKSPSAQKSEVDYFKLPSGIQVVYFERPFSHVFSLHASVLGGVRLELSHPIETPETDWGASSMLALTWTKGTTKKNARDIATIVEGRAAGIDGFSGRNSVGLQMTGLARDWQNLSDLFTEVLIDPVYPDDEVNHSRRVAEDSLRGIEDHSSQLCSKLFLETLFEKHPYGKIPSGSFESIRAIGGAKLRAFHQAWIRPERLVISVSGAVTRSALEIWLNELDEKMRIKLRTASGLKAFTPSSGKIASPADSLTLLASEPGLKAPRWVEKNLKREQTHILVGGLGSEIHADDRHAIRLMQTLLGGQSGRLFIELREKKSLAYTVAPTSFEGVERGYIGTYIACAPNKRQEAIEGIAKVLETLAKKGPTAAEMSRAKEFFLGRRAMDLQGDSSLAAHYGLEALYGVPYMSHDDLVKKVRSISGREIQNTCRKYLVEPFMVTSVVG